MVKMINFMYILLKKKEIVIFHLPSNLNLWPPPKLTTVVTFTVINKNISLNIHPLHSTLVLTVLFKTQCLLVFFNLKL